MSIIKIKRGLRSNVPVSNSAGELAFAMDTKELVIGNGPGIPNTLLVKKNNYDAVISPTRSNDGLQGYTVGSVWINNTTKKYYVCLDVSTGGAIWSESTNTTGDLTESTSSVLTIIGGAGSVLGSGATIQVKQSSGSTSGYLSATDWSTFNNKQDVLGYTPVPNTTTVNGHALSSNVVVTTSDIGAEPTLAKGNLSESTSSVLTIAGGTNSVIGSGTTITVKTASATQSGYLSTTDWNTFNGKQPLLGFVPENSANKAVANGYASLNSSSMLVQNIDAGNITTGTINIARLPAGALERLVVVANQAARFALTTSNVHNGDTVKQTDTGIMYYVVDDTNLSNASGYAIYTAGSAASAPWSGITGTPTTLTGYGISDAVPSTRTVNGHALSSNVSVTASDVGAEPTLTKGNLTESASSVLTIAGGTNAVIGSGITIQVKAASSTQAGYLSSTDWNTFNGKQAALNFGNLTEATSSILTITSGTNAVVGSGTTIQVKQASSTQSGYLSSTDWNTFNGKQSTLTLGNMTEAISSVLTISGATSSIIGTGVTIQVKQASSTQSGYLSSTDWIAFNNKQATITQGNLTESTSSVLTITGGTNAVIGSGSSIQVKQASTSQSGYLSSTDWNTFNNKNGIKNNYTATIAPTTSNDSSQGYAVGSQWVDTTAKKVYVCVSAAPSAASWTLYASSIASVTPRSFVQGARLSWISTTTLAISPGAINLAGDTYEISSSITVDWTDIATGTTKAASTWYYVYLKIVSGTLTPYISIAVPTHDAFGNAIADPSSVFAKYNSSWGRFVGSFKTDASQNITQFEISGSFVQYVGLGYGYILSNGNAKTKTAVNCRSLVPFTSGLTSLYFEDTTGSNGYKYVGDSVAVSTRFNRGGSGEVNVAVLNNSVYYYVDNDNINLGIHGYYEEI